MTMRNDEARKGNKNNRKGIDKPYQAQTNPPNKFITKIHRSTSCHVSFTFAKTRHCVGSVKGNGDPDISTSTVQK